MADQRFAPPPLVNKEDGTPWPTLNHPSQGEIGGSRIYEGKAPSIGIWKCPACRVENDGPLEQGCASCGAGAPGKHVGVDPPPAPAGNAIEGARGSESARAGFEQVRELMADGLDVHDAAQAWASAHLSATDEAQLGQVVVEAFLAGYRFALARTVRKAPPVTSDLPRWKDIEPEQKGRRTILAALRLFRDQVLAQTPDEIADGEWCSVEECDKLIAELEATL